MLPYERGKEFVPLSRDSRRGESIADSLLLEAAHNRYVSLSRNDFLGNLDRAYEIAHFVR